MAQDLEATPPASDWNALPTGLVFDPITQGTVDELLIVSEIITLSRSLVEPGYQGFYSYYNDNLGMIGPRIIVVEEGSFQLEPVDVSPGSSPGPALLVRPTEQGGDYQTHSRASTEPNRGSSGRPCVLSCRHIVPHHF